MDTKTHATEAVDFDVTDANGTHRIEHGLAAVNAALTAGALWAVEQERANWFGAGTEAALEQYRIESLAGGGL